MFQIKKTIKFISILCISFLFFSCEKDSEEYIRPKISEHTAIIYMLANNDLYRYAVENINKIESTWDDSYNGNCIILIEPINSNNKILMIQIKRDNDLNKISSPTIKTYQEIDPLQPENMKYLLNEVVQKYPSQKYSLILWSHGTGWVPSNTILRSQLKSYSNIPVKSFGQSNGKQMNITDLANGIPDNRFNTIIFDACYMASIEVLYELRNKANYIISSPAEILAQGFPYDITMPILIKEENPEIRVAQAYYDYYNTQSDIDYRSATISVVNTAELEGLASETKKIILSNALVTPVYDNISQIQTFDRYNTHLFYDLKQTMGELCVEDSIKPLFNDFNTQLAKTVLYSAHTESFLNIFKIKSSCGITSYIPQSSNQSGMKNYYKKLSWYVDSGYDILFDDYWTE